MPLDCRGLLICRKTNSMDNSIPKKHDKSCLVKQEPFHSLSGPSGSYSYAYGSNEYKHLHGSSDVGMGRNSFVGRDSIEENPFRDTYDYSLDKDKPCRNNLFYVRVCSPSGKLKSRILTICLSPRRHRSLTPIWQSTRRPPTREISKNCWMSPQKSYFLDYSLPILSLERAQGHDAIYQASERHSGQ